MSAWGTAAGAFVGTLVLTTVLRAASEFRLTRMDLPFLLGTAVTANRPRAKAIGYLMHFANGQMFAFVYYAVFVAIGHAGWWLGAVFGLVHGLFAGTALVNTLLPLVHPRMGSPLTSAPDVALLEPPGFLMRNYGPSTPLVTVLAHVAYGSIVGGFTTLNPD
ncbi:hypothetical protein [Actinomadura livida]|uniref:DUF1440 domain-containing protein n=1 Tax=Actinomadura livida TaxID=79909 RepID=A0A7W7MZL1_9ACTN|nr:MULTISPECIES: hypothetical protein [Actinomadura]MBB4776017.1 hypothetical protein [Actinomadura catellatispora]GGU16073.1 hypothetical protein GCM10010208_46480 [Actinomadura livida]